MTKQHRQIKAARSHDQQRLEQTEIIDDNLLPDAEEIQKLASIDPDIMTWLKSRAEKEQNHRHEYLDKRFKLTSNHDQRQHNTTRIGLLIYAVLVIGCVWTSYMLLMAGKDLQGTIFGSATVVLALAVLLTKKPSSGTESKD